MRTPGWRLLSLLSALPRAAVSPMRMTPPSPTSRCRLMSRWKPAQAAMKRCRADGYQVAVAVLDRFGEPQVMLRDRFAGLPAPRTATDKAWTALGFAPTPLICRNRSNPASSMRGSPACRV